MDTRDSNACHATQIIGADGVFDASGTDCFIKETAFDKQDTQYAVISIIGSQSSGKSTLLNYLYVTNFDMMDESKERKKTTNGIWFAKAGGADPFTLVMDVEGTDGSERGQDDTFEKQSALFALAISDVVLINIPYVNVGLERAANKHLLGNVFQVMLKLFDQQDKQVVPHSTTLIFVIRDKSKKASPEILDGQIRNSIRELWKNIPKPQALQNSQLSDFFNIEVAALPHYENIDDFKNEVKNLRQQISKSIEHGKCVWCRHGAVPASSFSLSVQRIWKLIKENEDLNLLNHKIVISTACCDQIVQKKFKSFCDNEEWQKWQKEVKDSKTSSVTEVITILNSYILEYKVEAKHYDESIRETKCRELETKLLQAIQPTYLQKLRNLRDEKLSKFKNGLGENPLGMKFDIMSEFDCEINEDPLIARANWDLSDVRNELQREIDHAIHDESQKRKLGNEKLVLIKEIVVAVSCIVGTVATILGGAVYRQHAPR